MIKGDNTRPAIVYCATNLINGKRYIGVTGHSLSTRIKQHTYVANKKLSNGAFHRAIRKYGIEFFHFFVLKRCDSITESLKDEVRLIALFKPEYNSTKGGDGNLGRKMSDETKLKLKEVHSGNKYCLGRKLTDEQKEIARQWGYKHQDIWKKYSHLGPRSISRTVLCLDDGKVYESASSASQYYGCSRSALIELCLGKNFRKTVNGRRFKYVNLEEYV